MLMSVRLLPTTGCTGESCAGGSATEARTSTVRVRAARSIRLALSVQIAWLSQRIDAAALRETVLGTVRRGGTALVVERPRALTTKPQLARGRLT